MLLSHGLRRRLELENDPKLVLRPVAWQGTLETLPFYELVVELSQEFPKEQKHLEFGQPTTGAHMPPQPKHCRKWLGCGYPVRAGRGCCTFVASLVLSPCKNRNGQDLRRHTSCGSLRHTGGGFADKKMMETSKRQSLIKALSCSFDDLLSCCPGASVSRSGRRPSMIMNLEKISFSSRRAQDMRPLRIR